MLSKSFLTTLAFSTLIAAEKPVYPEGHQGIQCINAEGYISVNAKDLASSFKDDIEVPPYVSTPKDAMIPQNCMKYGVGVLRVENRKVPCFSSQQNDYANDDPTKPKHVTCELSLWAFALTEGPKTFIKDIKDKKTICAITTTDAPQISGPVNTLCAIVEK